MMRACEHQFMTATPSNHSKSRQIILKREVTMKENFLVDLSKQFAVDIVNLCTDIKENRKGNVFFRFATEMIAGRYRRFGKRGSS